MFEGTFLVDTNSYVRIARSTTCVLGDHGGLELRLISEIAKECGRSSRLKVMAPWMLQPPHPEHRVTWTISLSKQENKDVQEAREDLREAIQDVLDEFAQKKRARGDNRSVLSTPDKALFYTAYGLGCGIVTDEGPLTALCKEFEVPHFTTLELLQQLVQTNVMSRAQVERIVKYWQFEKDEPQNWKKNFLALFGPPLPLLEIDPA